MTHRLFYRASLVSAATLLLLTPSVSVSAPSAYDIVEKMDKSKRDALRTSYSQLELSTCRFALKDKRPTCTEAPRIKRLESVGQKIGTDFKDSQNLSVVLAPAAEKGVGMLTYTYEDTQKDTESWLYLSALGKVNRMVSGNQDDQEPVAFFGSEFTTEDMESGKVDDYTYRMVTQGKYQQRNVWVIESKPKPERLRKTRYSKTLVWIDQERMTELKVQTYDKHGKLWKKILFANFTLRNQHWIAQDVRVFNLQKNRLSFMQQKQLNVDVTIPQGLLTQRSLTDFAFREQKLNQVRP